ncbi:MAG: cytidylate kinase-like family protein, partial [Deltaproteobacteria bacterium]
MAILTISREFGSGGKEVGRAVADSLGFEYVDKEKVLIEIRKAGNKWEEWGKELDEHSPSVWEKYDWSFRGFGALIQSFILSRAVKDKVVIMGRGGSFLLKGIPFALSVRIVAPIEARIARIVARESINQEK